MKKSTLSLYALIALACGSLTSAAQTTQRLTATKANDYALVYTLPVTRLTVTLEAEMTVKKPGEFYKYAKKYLDIDNPITQESHSARLKSATVTTQGVPDPDERYAVQFKSGTAPYMLLGSNGVPLAINTDKTMKTVAPELPEPQAAKPTPLETSAARQVVSEEMAQSQSTAKRAELAAAALFAIRQTRSDLITGQAEQTPPDGKSLQLMLDNLEAQEQALMAMFVGTTSTRTDVASFSITPDDNISDMVVARISPLDGIIDAGDLSGEPVYLNLKVTQEGELPLNEKGERLPFPKNGLAYCIPGSALVSVTYRGDIFFENNEEMAQFGVVYGLAPNSFTDKKSPIYVIFNPATGAIDSQGPAM
ncbi:MAG: DUF4831 family protein [Muribaculaceae bacterium]|nr:DUF4831 family protein [Muribaculaceae bacterium]